ncbi:peptidase S24/S26A/S26B/S26C [Auriculariales sp. MPI-PUGE-AT-0066]|nr:peptidase S24/S26A/S26B/S26C [Auriculariales sp. MPI-PUGE-AT-0066]
MRPTLNPDDSPSRDIILFDRTPVWTYLWTESFRRGDVVYLTSPEEPKQKLVKRIVALEGDQVRPLAGYPIEGTAKIPKNHAWIEGDEPLGRDSNTFGPVSVNLIKGRAVFIVWPLSRFGSLPMADSTSQDPWSVPRRLAAREQARQERVQPSDNSRR